jgi:hypothetical protein
MLPLMLVSLSPLSQLIEDRVITVKAILFPLPPQGSKPLLTLPRVQVWSDLYHPIWNLAILHPLAKTQDHRVELQVAFRTDLVQPLVVCAVIRRQLERPSLAVRAHVRRNPKSRACTSPAGVDRHHAWQSIDRLLFDVYRQPKRPPNVIGDLAALEVASNNTHQAARYVVMRAKQLVHHLI